MDQNVAHRTPHARHLLDRLGSDLQEQAFLFVCFLSCDCIHRMFFGTQTERRLPGADIDTGAVSFTSRRFNQARAETWEK